MKSIWWILTILIVFGFGCDDYKPEHGVPTIDEKTMEEMVSDVHLIEAYAQNVKASKRDSIKSVMYQALFEIYEVDTTEFYRNQRMYYEDPVAVENLYKEVLNVLDEKGSEKIDTSAEKTKDSKNKK